MAGSIHLITLFIEKRKSTFAVSRLMMLSGVNVRDFSETTPDDPDKLARIKACLPQILNHEELRALERLLAA